MKYRQCLLRRKTETGHETTSWIPESFCIVNKVLKLKNDDGKWTNGWIVIQAGEPKPEKWVIARERDFKNHRKYSDI